MRSPPLRMEPMAGVRLDQPNFSAPTWRHSLRWREEKGLFFSSSVRVSMARRSCDGVHLELDGELVHGGLEGEEAGDGAGAAHGRGRADVAADEGGGDGEVGGAVEEGRGFAAVLADVVERGRCGCGSPAGARRACRRAWRRGACAAGCAGDGRRWRTSSCGETVSLTGRLSVRAAAAASAECGHGKSLPPKPEPMKREMTSTFSLGTPRTWRHDVRGGSRRPGEVS